MNKSGFILGTAALLVLAVAGCGAPSAGNGSGTTGTGNTAANSAAGGLSAGSAPATTSYPLTVTDQTGHKLTIKARPTKIASTTEGTDEILTGLVPKKDIALVTTQSSEVGFSNVVPLVKGIPAISAVSAEPVIAVHPDLVLMASYNKPGVVQQIEQAGAPVYEFANFNSVPEIEQNILILGKLVDEQSKAQQMVNRVQSKIGAVKQAVKGLTKPTVLDYSSYGYAGGSGTTIQNIIADAGGVNVAAQLHGWVSITPEEVVKMNPQVIIDSTDGPAFKQKLLSDPALQSVSAIKHHRVYMLSGADLGSVSQYIYKAVQDVAAVLHPNAKLPK